MKVGSLLIDMAADVARLRADMTKATGIVDGAVSKMQSAVDGLKKGIAGLAAGLTVAAFTMAIKHQLELADAMSKTAERTGLQLKDVAGLQLAYSMAGISSDKLETSIGKMAKNMAEGSKAFSAMGVQIKNSDGSLRSTRDVLGDVADKFASYRDGAEKTALAQELFGKSGTEMISVLNGGAEALAESDAQAKKLGLTLDEEATAKAVQFNDTLSLLQAGGEGFTRQIAGRLAPTLASLASELLSNVGQSESLNTISAALSTTLKGLYSAGAIGAQIFANLGRAVGAGAAAIMAVLRGDFAGAKDIMADVSTVNAANWKAQLDSLGRLWDDTGAKATQAMATTAAASKAAAPIVAKVGDAAKKVKDEFADLMAELTAKDAGVDKDYVKKLAILQEGYLSGRAGIDEYRTAVESLTNAQQFAKDAAKKLIDVDKERAKQIEDYEKSTKDQAKTASDMLDQIKFETAALKMTNAERARAIALRDLERQGVEAGTEAYEQYAQAILTALDEKTVTEASIEAQNKIREEWQKTTDQMGQSLADALMQGGKSIAEYLKGLFRNLILRPIIQPIATGIAGMIMGGAAMAGQGGGGSALGLLGGASNLFSAGRFGSMLGIGNFGAGLGAGFGALFGESGLMGGLSAGATAIGAGNIGGGIGTLLGAGAPILAGVGLLANAFGLFRSLERKGGGLIGTLGQAGGVHDVDLMRKGGTLFSGPDWFTEDLGVSKLDKIIQTQFDASKAAIKGFAETLGLSTEKIDGFTTALGTQTMGDHGQLGIRLDKDGKPLSDQEVQAAIAEAIKAGSNELAQLLIGTWTETTRTVQRQVVENMGATLSDYGGGGGYASRTVTEQVTDRTYKPSEFAREGEQAIDTLTRLATSLGTVNGIFDTLGLTLYETSMKGGDLASQLADAAGGLDKLQAASANYYQNFYSAAEQHDIALRQLGKQFEALGVVMPATRDEFRHLVESLDLITEGGRTTFAALMNLSGSFAAVVPAVEEISSSTSEMGRAMGDAARATEDLAAMARKAEDEARRASERAAQDAAQAIVKAAQDAASAASEAARKASEAHSKASAMTDRVFAELRKQFDKALQAARTMVDTAQAIAQMTGERSRALYGEIPESRQYGAAAGNAFIDDALRTMLQGGAMPKTDELSRAIDSAVAGLDVNNYASVAQFQADKAILAAKLGAMEKVAGKQLTEGEQQVELLQQQLEHWDEQLSVLRDTQVSVTSIDDGVRQLSGLMAAESAAAGAAREAQDRYAQASLALQQAQQAQQGAAQQPGSIAGAYNSAVANIRAASWYGNGDWGEARGLKLSELSTAIGVDAGDLARLLVQQGLSLHGDLITTRDAYGDHDAEAAAIRAAKWYGSGNWDDARGSSLIGLAKSMGVDPVDLERRLIAEGMQVSADGIVLSKRYAQGGLHSGGWRLVGEQGPEVEFTGPARYWSFDQSRSMLSGGGGGNEELIAENRALRAKVDQLIARLDRVAAATETSARLMDRVTANGNAMRTEAA